MLVTARTSEDARLTWAALKSEGVNGTTKGEAKSERYSRENSTWVGAVQCSGNFPPRAKTDMTMVRIRTVLVTGCERRASNEKDGVGGGT